MPLDLTQRPRRLRNTENLRCLVRETRLTRDCLIYPVFFHAGPEDIPVESMPGVFRRSVESLVRECLAARDAGLRAVALFPSLDSSLKDETGSAALDPDGLLYSAIREVKAAAPDLLIVADAALDPYTSHGHDGILEASGKDVANDETVEILCRLAVMEAAAGADVVAPSDMMDGRVGAIRRALDDAGFHKTAILAYSAKYASAYYGPFREAVGSKIGKDSISKSTYQMDPANKSEALREAHLDEMEGADMVMVKPAGAYLDVIAAVKSAARVPVAAYQVSGEYSQIHAAARLGWLDYKKTRDESLLAIRRAGADVILTYFALEVAREWA